VIKSGIISEEYLESFRFLCEAKEGMKMPLFLLCSETIPKLYRWTLLFPNKTAFFHNYKESPTYSWRSTKLESNSIWTCKHGKRQYPN